MRRKIVAILLAVMTVSTAVIGCGDNKTTETESKKVQTSTETSDHDEIKKYIKNADEIIVLTENGIAERGTHETLLDKNGIYAAYYNMT